MVSISREERRFLDIMVTGIQKNRCGNWQTPLPFRRPNIAMPDNQSLVVNRLNGLLCTSKKKSKMKEDYFQFMAKVFERGHAVPIPREELPVTTCLGKNEPNEHGPQDQGQTAPIRSGDQVWYLSPLWVYHPRKPDQIRVVFDSSAEFHGVSLNNYSPGRTS